jgi:hypothetical protein
VVVCVKFMSITGFIQVIVHDRQGQLAQINEALFRLSTVILGANTHVR